MRIARLLAAGIVAMGALSVAARADDRESSLKVGRSILTQRQKPCGAAENQYLCGVMRVSTPNFVTEPLTLTLNKGDVATVTWTGTVYCEIYPLTSKSGGVYSYNTGAVGTIQLLSGDQAPPVANGEGSATFGRNDLYTSPEGILFIHRQYFLAPISLTRQFNIAKTGNVGFAASTTIDFRAFDPGRPPFCNLNGGSMTALIVR